MKGQVVIVDERPSWMKQEDRVMTCLLKCPVHKHCSVRLGADCKRLGGTEIPKMQGRRGAVRRGSLSVR